MNWFLIALLYPLLYSFVNIIDKFLIEKKVRNYYSYSVLTGILLLLSVIIVWLFVGFPSVSGKVLFFGILSGVTYGIIYLMYFHLLSREEVSRIIGAGYLFAAFVAVYSRIFLGEMLSWIKYAAIAVAIIGTMLLSINRRRKQAPWHFFLFMVGYAAILAIVDVSDKYVLNYITFWEAYVLLTIPLVIVIMSPILLKKVRKDFSHTCRVLPGIFAAQVFTVLGSFAFLKAASLGPIAIVSAIGTMQPVFVFFMILFLSIFVPKLLKEVITPKAVAYKIIGIACVVGAAAVLGS